MKLQHLLIVLLLFLPSITQSQIITDSSLGPAMSLPGPNYQIGADLGQQHGGHLFYSFQKFNLNSAESATFSGPNSVRNILSRVTGGNSSNLDGLIRSTIPNANFYFLNPYGIVFGPHAQLDVQGSFHASTADYLRLGEEGRFEARNLSESLLTVAPVEAFGFLTEIPAPITLQDSTLSVPENKVLSLIGGNLNINGKISSFGSSNKNLEREFTTQLIAPFGRINLASVASKSEVIPTEFGLDLSAGTIGGNFIIDQGKITTSGIGGGNIFIRAGQFKLLNSDIISEVLAEQNGKVPADTPHLMDEGEIATSTANAGGGNIEIKTTDLIYLQGGRILTNAQGNIREGGNINITNPTLVVLNDSRIIAQAKIGNGGNIRVAAKQFIASPDSLVSASSGLGLEGHVNIETPEENLNDNLVVLSDDQIDASALMNKPCSTYGAEKERSHFQVHHIEGVRLSPHDRQGSDILFVPAVTRTTKTQNRFATQDLWQEGENFFQQGDMIQAIQTWEWALSITPPTQAEHIDALIHLAIAHQTRANYAEAKKELQHILTLFEENIGHHEQKVIVHSHLGDVLLALQNPVRAKIHLDKALKLARNLDDPSILGHLYNNRCNLLSVEKLTEEASVACDKAVKFAQRHHDPTLYLQALNNQIRHLLQQDNLSASIDTLDIALAQVRQHPDSHRKAFHLLSFGQLALTIEKKFNFHKLDIYQILQEALQLSKTYNDKQLIAYAHGYLGQLYEQRKRYSEALQLTRQAIFFSQDLPELLYLWEWQRGRILHAQQDLSGAITAHQQAINHLRPIYTHLYKGQRDARTAFQERIRAVYFSFADVLLKQTKKQTSPTEKTALINQARNIFEEMKKAEMESYFQDECVTASHQTQTSVEDLERHTVVLHPVLLPDRTEILYHLPDGVHQLVIPIGANTVQKTVAEFRENLQSIMHYRFLKQAATLYNWFIAPLKEDLVKHQIDTLVIVPDGVLRTIPFAALFDQQEKVFLVQQFAMAVAHSLNLTEPRPLPRENLSILLEGLSEGVQNFSPLPYVPHEIEQVGRLFEQKVVLTNQEFSLRNTQQALKTAAHNIVHIASHGQFDRNPNKTFILTYEGKLTMDRLEQLLTLTRSREEAIELLTLSACQTAVGDEHAALGLAGVAIKAGAKSALASLWFVNDQSTSQLISEFYRQLQEPALSKAKALQKSQIKLIDHPKFRHPAYWAPFLLIGNWL